MSYTYRLFYLFILIEKHWSIFVYSVHLALNIVKCEIFVRFIYIWETHEDITLNDRYYDFLSIETSYLLFKLRKIDM